MSKLIMYYDMQSDRLYDNDSAMEGIVGEIKSKFQNRKEYLAEVAKCKINEQKVAKIKKVYNSEIPEIIAQIISYSNKSIHFGDGYRTLSFSEILDAEQDLGVDFTKLRMIPLFDCGDNDFIVYNFGEGRWLKFNIVDKSSFKKKSQLSELF